NATGNAESDEIFQISSDDQVLIEIISIDGKYAELITLLQTPDYGLSYTIDNGPNSLLITGYFPIENLLKLNALGNLINFVRAVYTPILNGGAVVTQGDTAQGSYLVRDGWGIHGEGLKIGVISDSFNNLLKADDDVGNGDLPGVGNLVNETPVIVLKEYPSQGIFFNQFDEGRAMAQIVHDIVPKADLLFYTGLISSGDFANGILQLTDVSTDIIFDDVTHITEPYFQDGIVAQAVNYANSQGVFYSTSAGNFGKKSYESTSSPISFNKNGFDFLPNDNTLKAHDFGGGDILQSLSLMPGRYLIKFEWDEPFYTLRQLTGALTNYDVWIVDDDQTLLYSGNRDNVGEDPQEYQAFTVPGNQSFPINILITASNMPTNQNLKYTIFKGADFIWNDQNPGIEAGTIVGHANAVGAITVGAALYLNTPPYGVYPPTIASFSSRGGVTVNGENRLKPDFVGPNGVNTTVELGGLNIDGDLFPNFFGTSASAPHIAGVAAQLLEAGKKYYLQDFSPTEIKEIMKTSAIDMGAPGHDTESGYGFVQANQALQNLANPSPQLIKLIVPEGITAGTETFELIAQGSFFTTDSEILFRGDALETEFLSDTELKATIVEFIGDPEISVNTGSKTPSGIDGGI
ncbi:MAG: S8 family serine peptidase, partial [Cyclobacteriaceae bacterium]|nr:S8 family serine peptidase [Cyclobacteriaceae bacterium]